MNWPPHITVAVVCKNAQGKYLVVEELIEGKVCINQPAGHLDPGETLFEAALRETLEETGWEVKLTGYLGMYVYRSPLNGVIYHRHCFIAAPVIKKSQTLDKEIIREIWMPIEELRHCTNLRSPLVMRCFEDHASGIAYPLTLLSELR